MSWLIGGFVSALIPFLLLLLRYVLSGFKIDKDDSPLVLTIMIAILFFALGAAGAFIFDIWWFGPIVAVVGYFGFILAA